MKDRPIQRTLRYIKHLGPRAGLQAARILCGRERAVTVRVPGVRHPLHVRAGTSDVETFEEVFVAREYDLPFTDMNPGHILDLGANVGFASVHFAARWPRARILAVEPAAHNAAPLERNTRNWQGISRIQAAVWARPAHVTIANPLASANAFQMCESSDPPGAPIEAFTVPQLMSHLGCAHVDLLKMDVEGAEAEIFRSGTEWLDRVSVMIVELHDRIVPGCAEALFQALQRRRFRQEIVGANLAFDFR